MENSYEKIKEKLNSLDNNYFHWSITIDKNVNVTWVVYYNNMNDENYFKKTNKPILNSKDNDLQDIEKLNKKIKEIKKEAKKNIIYKTISHDFEMFDLKLKIKEIISNIYLGTNISLFGLYIILFILRVQRISLGTFAITMLIINFILAAITSYAREVIDNKFKITTEKLKENLVRIYLQDKDIKELKNEFTKKNRKKQSKENKTKRRTI